jgi:prepilin-type N-terminal cleavage/methylation domain-containing protein
MNRNGFTLVETLVATMILAIGVVSVFQLFAGGLRISKTSEKYSDAIRHARQKTEEILIESALSEGGAEGTFEDGYDWEIEIIPIREEEEKNNPPVVPFYVKVRIRWEDGIHQKSYEIHTIKIAREIMDPKSQILKK